MIRVHPGFIVHRSSFIVHRSSLIVCCPLPSLAVPSLSRSTSFAPSPMPTYEYACPKCGLVEAFQSIKEDALTKCPKCKKQKVTRMVSGGGGVIFKGSGFWETDYNRSKEYANKAKKDAAAPSEGSSESKSESKSEGKSEGKPDTQADTKASDTTENKSDSKKSDSTPAKAPEPKPQAQAQQKKVDAPASPSKPSR